jgi:hypothetical protein
MNLFGLNITRSPHSPRPTHQSSAAPVTGGGVITIVPTQPGSGLFASLDVMLGPPAALAAGGGWRIQGDGFYPNYHTTAHNLVAFTVPGTKTIEFKQIAGWDLVASTNVTVTLGQSAGISALYTQVAAAPPAPPVLVVSRTFGLGITGATGVTFRLEYRNSLRTGQWLPLKTNTLGPGTNFLLTLPFTNGPATFYRAVWLP